jgi:hypothetical protein
VKCADDHVLLAKEETVLQVMIGRLTEVGRCFGVEPNEEKCMVMRTSRQPFPICIIIDKKQLENVRYFSSLGSLRTSDVRCTCEINSGFYMTRVAFNNKKALFHQQTDLDLRKKLVNFFWSIALFGAKTWTLGSFEIWCCGRIEKISWTNCVKNEEVRN